jgi:hypothetical protein
VLVTADFNAAVTQLPRLGVFGWHRNYLMVGLPLLRSLSVVQLEAVLAHELGHLSRGHARLGNWIYRLRRTWQRLDQALEARPQWGSGLIRRFLGWYAPYFNACSYPLARQSEFEADATSAQITSRQAAAQALTNVSVIGSYLGERYWPQVRARARDMPQPAFGPFSDYAAPPLAGADADTQRWLVAALAERTTYSDSHPCLRERLQALGAEAEVALPAAGSAADRLLGAASARLAGVFDSSWRAGVRDSWQKVYENTQQGRSRLAQLRLQASAGPLTAEQGVELAGLEEEVGEGGATALALRRQLVAAHPHSPLARFVLARQLLAAGDEAGAALMEGVLAEEPQAIAAGSELLRDYWWRRGERDKAQHWHERLTQRQLQLQQAKQERERLLPGDSWLAHGLDAASLEVLVARLGSVPGLSRAYLVRKRVLHRPEAPLYVLGFAATTLGVGNSARSRAVMVQLRSAVEFPGETLIISVQGTNQHFGRAFRAVPGSQIL